MKTLLTILLLTINLTSKAQVQPTIMDSIIVGVNAEVAKKDIQTGNQRLLLSSGIASMTYVGQEKFEEKYGVKYYEYGCTGPDKKEMTEYNKEIFKYLDKKYGKAWRKEIRKDVVGL